MAVGDAADCVEEGEDAPLLGEAGRVRGGEELGGRLSEVKDLSLRVGGNSNIVLVDTSWCINARIA